MLPGWAAGAAVASVALLVSVMSATHRLDFGPARGLTQLEHHELRGFTGATPTRQLIRRLP